MLYHESCRGSACHSPWGERTWTRRGNAERPGPDSDAVIADIVKAVPPPVATFLLTSCQSVADIVAHHQRVRTSTIQIVDTLIQGTYAELRERLPGIQLVQVIHVMGQQSVDDAIPISSQVDALLLDSGRADLSTKELGGTGRRHDWTISQRIREAVSVPIFLAGGLKAEQCARAIREVGPFGLIFLFGGAEQTGRLIPQNS